MARRPRPRKTRPQTPKPRKHETLEPRVVMSANPIGGPMIGHHSMIEDEPPSLSHHGMGPSMGSAIVESAPAVDPDADFWLDRGSDLDWDDLDAQFDQIEQLLNDAHDLTGQDNVVSTYGFDGGGQTVAVIDSGIAYSHYALGGGLGEGYRVVGGWDFTENDADFYDDGPEGSHGTHVAGIVGAVGDGAHSGVATGVDMVGLRVFDDAGNGYFSWVEQALQWVHTNRNAFDNPITAVNLSLGTEWNSDNVPSWAMLENEFAQLEAAGIFVSVSAGNSFADYNTKGVSYPAASDHVVPVMSVDNNGQLSYFSQRAEYAIAAPGRWITSTVPDYAANDGDTIDDDWLSMSGTSMAAPYVAGASMLIREAMEFVGQTGIDQWDIYDHMMATADTFYDSATDTNYKRLNLEAAIDALMPEDDFGSSVATAHNLGTLNDSSSSTPLSLVSGAITTLDDADYFTFTAGVTGTVTVNASGMTHDMVAEWDAWGGAWNDQGNGSCVIDVVAGQTYTFALSSADGLGYYDLDINVESSFAAIAWGAIGAQETRSGLSVSGEQWYEVTAGREGYFTVESLPQNGAATVALYDAQQNLLAAAGSRADALALAGETLLIRVVGESTNLDLRLTNALNVTGGAATLVGTTGDDVLAFVVGSTEHDLSLNGVSYALEAASTSSVAISAGEGDDTVSLTGASHDETLHLRWNSLSYVSGGLTVTASQIEQKTVYSGGGVGDIAYFYDTGGDESYTADPDSAVMQGSGFRNEAVGFAKTWAYASGGNDIADLYDGDTDDRLIAGKSYALLLSRTGTFFNYTTGFDHVTADASGGGGDHAIIYGTAGDESFSGNSASATMQYSVDQSSNVASAFDAVYAYGNGGNDVADLRDGLTDDRFIATQDWAVLQDTGGSFSNYASGFSRVDAFASVGGNDVAYLHDGVNDDRFVSGQGYGIMLAVDGAFYNYSAGFESVYAVSTHGGQDIATMYDSVNDDTFTAHPTYAVMRDTGTYYNYAGGFDQVLAYATQGGNDEANLHGSASNDLLVSTPDQSTLRAQSGGYTAMAAGFGRVNAYGNGGADNASLIGGDTDDRFISGPAWGLLLSVTGEFRNYASGFATITAEAGGGNDIATMYDSSSDDLFTGRSSEVLMAAGNGSYSNTASGFEGVLAFASGGDDSVSFYDSSDDDEFEGLGALARLNWDASYASTQGFDSVRIESSMGGDDSLALGAIDYALEQVGVWS